MSQWRDLLGSIKVSQFLRVLGPSSLESCEMSEPLPHVLQKLTERSILSMPVYDKSKGKWRAFVDLVDIVAVAARLFEEKNGIGDFYAVAINDNVFKDMNVGQVVGASNRNPFIPVSLDDSMTEVCRILADRGAHRVPVMDGNDIAGIITQSNVVEFLFKHIKEHPHLNSKTVAELDLGTQRDVVTIHEDTKAIQGFRLMNYARVSGVAIVDDEGELISVLSVKDLRAIIDPKTERVNFSDVLLGARQFTIKAHDIDHIGHKATADDLKARHPMFSAVYRNSTFEQVLQKLHATRIHRLFIVDNEHKPIGCIALRDVIALVLRS